MLLNAAGGAVRGMARGASAAYHGTIDVSLGGYNHIVKPTGSAAMNTLSASFAAVRNLAAFVQESVTGVEFVEGHPVSGRADSLLTLPQQLLSAPLEPFFTRDGRELSEKGLEFVKKARTYAGGVTATLIYQTSIVLLADTVGRVGAQAVSDELEEGNFTVPLMATGALALFAVGQGAHLLYSMKLGGLSEAQRSAVIATHHGITPEEFDAKTDTEKAELEARTKRDWLIMGGAAALMPIGAFGMSLFAKLSPAKAFANPLFMTMATNIVKVAVRSPLYGGLRETLQEIFSGPKGGVADMTHTEAGRSALKYGGISATVNMAQSAAPGVILNKPQATNWGEKFRLLMTYSLINGIGESLNWVDLTTDRTKKCAELAKKDLIKQHKAAGMPPPTQEELKEVAEQAEFAFNLGVKEQGVGDAIRNLYRRYGGSLFAREGVYAFSNAISTLISELQSQIEGADKGSYGVLKNLIAGFCTTFAYIKFNACSQSLGALRAQLAQNEKESAPAPSSSTTDFHRTVWQNALMAIEEEEEEGSSIGEMGGRSASVHIDSDLGKKIANTDINKVVQRSYSIHSIDPRTVKRQDSRTMSDFN